MLYERVPVLSIEDGWNEEAWKIEKWRLTGYSCNWLATISCEWMSRLKRELKKAAGNVILIAELTWHIDWDDLSCFDGAERRLKAMSHRGSGEHLRRNDFTWRSAHNNVKTGLEVTFRDELLYNRAAGEFAERPRFEITSGLYIT